MYHDRLVGCLNVLAGLRGRGRIRVQMDLHCAFFGADIATSDSMTSPARNNAPILDPMQSSLDPMQSSRT